MHDGICICEQDEVAVRVHKALVWDIPYFADGGYVPANVPPGTPRATRAPEQHRRFPFTCRIEDGELVVSKRPAPSAGDLTLAGSIASGAVSLTTVGQRAYDPPKEARDWAKIVSGFCPASTHFPNIDLEMELGKPVYTSSDPEKAEEDAKALEDAMFAEARTPWIERFEPKGEDAYDDFTRRQRDETIARRAPRKVEAGPETRTRHQGSMTKRWTQETAKGRRWLETKQRIEKVRWQEFYRLARAVGKDPTTAAAKAWVETVGMDEALRILGERVPVAA